MYGVFLDIVFGASSYTQEEVHVAITGSGRWLLLHVPHITQDINENYNKMFERDWLSIARFEH